jgi:hypothetical protein
MFLVSAPTSACRALSEDICSFGVLLICVDPSLGVPGGRSIAFSFSDFSWERLATSCIRGSLRGQAIRQSIMVEEQSCLTRVNLYISLQIFWKYRMLSIVRRGSSKRSLLMMFLYPLPDRSPGLLEVPVASSVDGCGAPASQQRVQCMKSVV